jgi:hypothetical protein
MVRIVAPICLFVFHSAASTAASCCSSKRFCYIFIIPRRLKSGLVDGPQTSSLLWLYKT